VKIRGATHLSTTAGDKEVLPTREARHGEGTGGKGKLSKRENLKKRQDRYFIFSIKRKGGAGGSFYAELERRAKTLHRQTQKQVNTIEGAPWADAESITRRKLHKWEGRAEIAK